MRLIRSIFGPQSGHLKAKIGIHFDLIKKISTGYCDYTNLQPIYNLNNL
jgi:hypothetical protein